MRKKMHIVLAITIVTALFAFAVTLEAASWQNAGSYMYTTDGVTIGASHSPQRMLNIRDQTSKANVFIGSNGDPDSNISYIYSGGGDCLRLGADGHTGDLVITKSGNIGMGTTDPQAKLEISSESSLDNPQLLLCDTATVAGLARLYFKESDNDDVWGITGSTTEESSDARMYIYYDNPGYFAGYNIVFTGDAKTGIGNYDPDYKLEVAHDQSSGPVVRITNENTGAYADVLTLKVECPTAGNGNNFISFYTSGAVIGNIDGNGAGGVRYNTTGSDFAEWLPRLKAEEVIEPGDIVGVTAGEISKITQNSNYIQVVSTAPGWVGNCPGEEKESLYEQVAFLGQAPIKVRGAARAGDFIIPSGLNDGIGIAVSPKEMDSERCGQIVGRTMESSENKDVKLVRSVVGLHAASHALREVSQAKDRQIEELTSRLDSLEQMVKEMKE